MSFFGFLIFLIIILLYLGLAIEFSSVFLFKKIDNDLLFFWIILLLVLVEAKLLLILNKDIFIVDLFSELIDICFELLIFTFCGLSNFMLVLLLFLILSL